MTKHTPLERRVAELSNQVASLYRTVIDFQDRLGGHELEENKLIVKAANAALSGPTQSNDTLMRRLNGFEGRFNKLEATLKEAGEQKALGVLAKAASATQRLSTPEGILERAEKVLTDPTQMGVVASYVSTGQLVKAVDMIRDAEARDDRDDEDGALERVQNQLDEHAQLATLSKLGETVANLQRGLNAMLGRLSALEARPAASAPMQTVAKAAQPFGRRQAQQADPRETAQGLMTRAEGVIDSPGRIGHLSSMIQAGQLDEARRVIEQAELAHESDAKKSARRRF